MSTFLFSRCVDVLPRGRARRRDRTALERHDPGSGRARRSDYSGLVEHDVHRLGWSPNAILNAVAHLPSGCLILHGVDNRTQRILDNLGIGRAPNLHIIPCEKGLERDRWTVGLVEPSTLGSERLGG
jgi:hypothetical protein